MGSGPNGLAAAITLARHGVKVLVLEARDSPGGGARSAEVTAPGFTHDLCSAIVPLTIGSPFFRDLPLSKLEIELAHPEFPLAHPLDNGEAAVLERSVVATATRLGIDAPAYRKLMAPLVHDSDALMREILGPLRVPKHPIVLARLGLSGIRSARGVAFGRFKTMPARGLLAGIAAHSMLPLDKSPTAAFGLLLAILAHAVGWPAVRGGTQSLIDGMAAHLEALGGTLETDSEVKSLRDLPGSRAVLFDLGPRQVIDIAGDALPGRYVRALTRFRYGPGVFKVDWALDGPVPWTAPDVARAGTVHLGGTFPEIAASEEAVARGRHPERPYVLIAQQSMFDDSRAPTGKHTLWGYCHVPAGSTVDMTDRIEDQIERFAPGFRDLVIERAVRTAVDMEAYNANYVGGDINVGVQDLFQHYTRPAIRLDPYSTPNRRLYICSSATPPGGGVHGMCGYHAAHSALRRVF